MLQCSASEKSCHASSLMERCKFNLIMCPGMNIMLDDAPHQGQGASLDLKQTLTFV